jgi:hypothetical protein
LRPWRTALGLLLAPVAGGGVGLSVYALTSQLISGKPFFGAVAQDTFLSALAIGIAFGGYIGSVPALVIGWPLHVLLLRRGWTHPLAYMALGLLIAFIAFALIGPLFGFGSTLAYEIASPALLISGPVGGLVLWSIRRPDHDARVRVDAPR